MNYTTEFIPWLSDIKNLRAYPYADSLAAFGLYWSEAVRKWCARVVVHPNSHKEIETRLASMLRSDAEAGTLFGPTVLHSIRCGCEQSWRIYTAVSRNHINLATWKPRRQRKPTGRPARRPSKEQIAKRTLRFFQCQTGIPSLTWGQFCALSEDEIDRLLLIPKR
jgi:hypothetical protein